MSLQYQVLSTAKGNERVIAEFINRGLATEYMNYVRKRYDAKFWIRSKKSSDWLEEASKGLSSFQAGVLNKEGTSELYLKCIDVKLAMDKEWQDLLKEEEQKKDEGEDLEEAEVEEEITAPEEVEEDDEEEF